MAHLPQQEIPQEEDQQIAPQEEAAQEEEAQQREQDVVAKRTLNPVLSQQYQEWKVNSFNI
jgi:hypothetical protein